MATSKKSEQFSKKETQQRFEAALLGARIAGHKPMESMTPKHTKVQQRTRGKAKRPSA